MELSVQIVPQSPVWYTSNVGNKSGLRKHVLDVPIHGVINAVEGHVEVAGDRDPAVSIMVKHAVDGV